jgi:glucokinase
MVLAYDIGGTHIRRGVLKGDGLLTVSRHPSRDLAASLEHLTAEAIAEHPGIKGVAISFAGQVSGGLLQSAPNIDPGALKGQSIPAWFKSRFNLPATIDNDLKCAALAEAAAHPAARALAVLYIGTGFGGALVQEGRLIRGSGNQAGEIGHIPFEPAPFACGCGRTDCLELSTSGSGVARWCAVLGIKEVPLGTLRQQGTPEAEAIVDRFIRGLSHALKTLAPLFNPDQIVLGGGVVHHNPWLLSHAQEAIAQSFKPVSTARVELSTLGDEANLIGAAKALEVRSS